MTQLRHAHLAQIVRRSNSLWATIVIVVILALSGVFLAVRRSASLNRAWSLIGTIRRPRSVESLAAAYKQEEQAIGKRAGLFYELAVTISVQSTKVTEQQLLAWFGPPDLVYLEKDVGAREFAYFWCNTDDRDGVTDWVAIATVRNGRLEGIRFNNTGACDLSRWSRPESNSDVTGRE